MPRLKNSRLACIFAVVISKRRLSTIDSLLHIQMRSVDSSFENSNYDFIIIHISLNIETLNVRSFLQ